jgi:hypothetical protein
VRLYKCQGCRDEPLLGARSGEACMIYGYAGNGLKLAKAIRDFASQYADPTDADCAKFMTAIRSKKLRGASARAT